MTPPNTALMPPLPAACCSHPATTRLHRVLHITKASSRIIITPNYCHLFSYFFSISPFFSLSLFFSFLLCKLTSRFWKALVRLTIHQQPPLPPSNTLPLWPHIIARLTTLCYTTNCLNTKHQTLLRILINGTHSIKESNNPNSSVRDVPLAKQYRNSVVNK